MSRILIRRHDHAIYKRDQRRSDFDKQYLATYDFEHLSKEGGVVAHKSNKEWTLTPPAGGEPHTAVLRYEFVRTRGNKSRFMLFKIVSKKRRDHSKSEDSDAKR